MKAVVNKILRFIWCLIMYWTRTPMLPHHARGWVLRRLGVALPKDGKINHGSVIGSTKVVFGKYFQSNINCHFDGSHDLIFGDYVTVGARVAFITGTHPIGLAYRRRGWEEKPNPLRIGDGAWIGCGAIIQADVAAGCVIASGSIVTKPTEPNGLYAGSPARRIRDLGEE